MPSASVEIFWPTKIREPSARDVKLGDAGGVARGVAVAGSLQAASGLPEGRWRRPGSGRFGGRDRRRRRRRSSLPSGSNWEVELKTKWLPSAEKRFLTRPSERPGWGFGALHPLHEAAVGQVQGHPGGAVGETGRADFRAAEGEGVEGRVGFGEGRGEGGGRWGRWRGCRRRRCSSRRRHGRHIGVDAAVGRVAGDSRDGAAVDPVEDPGRVFGFRVAFERASGRGPDRTRRHSRRRGGRDELVGAAVGDQGRPGLLAGQGVGAGVVQFRQVAVGGEAVVGAVGGARRVGRDRPVVVDRGPAAAPGGRSPRRRRGSSRHACWGRPPCTGPGLRAFFGAVLEGETVSAPPGLTSC